MIAGTRPPRRPSIHKIYLELRMLVEHWFSLLKSCVDYSDWNGVRSRGRI